MSEKIQIVEAVAASANAGGGGSDGKKSHLGRFVEAVITQAIQGAYDDGITDVDIVKQRIQAAREAALTFYERETAKMLQLPAAQQREPKVPTEKELNSQSG